MKRASIQPVFFSVGVVVLLTFLEICSSSYGALPFCDEIAHAPVVAASAEPPTLVFEDFGTIKVMHGSGCAHLDKNKGIYLKVERSIDIPAYANKAAVFLNGWKLKYSGGDHHVEALAAAIGKIKFEPATFEPAKLTWNAVGVLGDDGHDKAIDWCDWYTVVAWNDTNLHAFVDQGDAEYFCKSGGTPSASDNFFFAMNRGTTTALSWFPSFLYNANFPSGPTVAILPRGFGFRGSDHHLLQVAHNLEHSERFIQSWGYKKADGELNPLPTPPTGRVGSGFVSWSTYGIFKDKHMRSGYELGELVSAMGGPDVGIIEPPFSILPHEDMGGFFGACLDAPVGVKTEDVVIDNVPYAYAIPMLRSWELAYGCNDHHVREVGIWIDNLQYAKAPNASSGTLSYRVSSTLHDDSGHWHNYRHKVAILGLRHLVGTPVR
jgi:hypothetical protein